MSFSATLAIQRKKNNFKAKGPNGFNQCVLAVLCLPWDYYFCYFVVVLTRSFDKNSDSLHVYLAGEGGGHRE
jgi:hypothetical protein